MTSSAAVFEAEIRLKSRTSRYMMKSWLKTKNEKMWKSKKCLHKSPSKRWFRNVIHSLIRRNYAMAALTSFTVCDALFFGSGLVFGPPCNCIFVCCTIKHRVRSENHPDSQTRFWFSITISSYTLKSLILAVSQLQKQQLMTS